MQPHQQRVVDEKEELDVRLSKLTVFTGTDAFKALPEQDQALMIKQQQLMEDLSWVLGKRIQRF